MRAIRIGVNPDDVKVIEIENKLEDLQQAVGGYIEVWRNAELEPMNIVGIVDEEGVLKHKTYNLNTYPFFIVGTMLLVALNEDKEDFTGLDDGQLMYAQEWLAELRELRY